MCYNVREQEKQAAAKPTFVFLPRERANSLRQQTISTQCGFASAKSNAVRVCECKVECSAGLRVYTDVESKRLARSAGLRVEMVIYGGILWKFYIIVPEAQVIL